MSAEQRSEVRDRQKQLAVELAGEGWTQEEVGALLGVTQPTIAKWLRGRTTGSGTSALSIEEMAEAEPEPPVLPEKKTHRLTKAGRNLIVKLSGEKVPQAQIAAEAGVHTRTVKSVVAAHKKQSAARAEAKRLADEAAEEEAARADESTSSLPYSTSTVQPSFSVVEGRIGDHSPADQGWTQERIGALLGVTQQRASEWLRGGTTGSGTSTLSIDDMAAEAEEEPEPPVLRKKTHRLTKAGRDLISTMRANGVRAQRRGCAAARGSRGRG